LFNARAYRGKIQCIITIDTKEFLDKYSESVTLSPINSGSTIFNPQPRGPETFLSLNDFPYEYWKLKRKSKSKAIVELTVDYAVLDIAKYVTNVVHMRNDKIIENIL
jgi:hypothetical protein